MKRFGPRLVCIEFKGIIHIKKLSPVFQQTADIKSVIHIKQTSCKNLRHIFIVHAENHVKFVEIFRGNLSSQ